MELVKNTIHPYREINSITKEEEESIDVIVPDINPDVVDIVSAAANATVREREVIQNQTKISGEVTVKVVYTTDGDNRLHTFSGQMPYSYTYDIPNGKTGDKLIATCTPVYADAVMINPRKLTLKAGLAMNIRTLQQENVEIVENVSSLPEEGIFTMTDTKPWTYLADVVDKKIGFNEELRILSGAISEDDLLVRAETDWITEDVKVLSGKVMLKGNVELKIATISPESTVAAVNTYKLPFSQIVESENVTPDDEIDIDYNVLHCDVRLVGRGEGELYLYYSLSAETILYIKKNTQLKTLVDVYSTCYDVAYDTAEFTGSMQENQILQTDAGGVIEVLHSAEKIIDYSIKKHSSCKTDCAAASYFFSILYEDSSGCVRRANKRFDVELPVAGACNCTNSVPAADFVSVSAEGGAVQVNFKAVVAVKGLCKEPRKQIRGCNLNMDKPRTKTRDASIVLRTVENNENVWKIAKHYATSPDAILSANHMKDDSELTAGKLIIIPFSQ